MSDAYQWLCDTLSLSQEEVERIDILFSSSRRGGVEDMYQRLLLKKKSFSDSSYVFSLASDLNKDLENYFSSPQISPDSFAPVFREVETELSSPYGWVLSWEVFERLLHACPPVGTLAALGYSSVKELVSKESLYDIAAGLRFLEEKAWLHESFFPLYEKCSFSDFEYRPLHFHVLSETYAAYADAFIEKKYHNVSHLKELGLIFIIPTARVFEGQLLRTVLLLFHYMYEVSFYTRLFEYHKEDEHFGHVLSSLLRGDVIEKRESVPDTAILIVQRYLSKEGNDDWRLSFPHINPEALHWYKAEKLFFSFAQKHSFSSASLWEDTSWMGYVEGGIEYSFNIMDVSMSVVAHRDSALYTYHQHEALWNEWYGYYHGYDTLENRMIEHMQQGFIE